MKLIFRRIRGALGNALIWGAGWFVASYAVGFGFNLLDPRAPLSLLFSAGSLMVAVKIALAGAAVGGAFSAYIAANFRNKRLRDLSPGRFALGGGLVTLVFVLATGLWTSLNSDWPFFLSDLIEPVLIFGSIGVITGYGTIKLAQKALPESSAPPELEAGGTTALHS